MRKSSSIPNPQSMEGNRKRDGPQSLKLTWRIENFSTLKAKRLYSPTFCVGGNKWRVSLWPKGNNVPQLSIYLDVADSATLTCGWSIHAQFCLSVVSQVDSKFTVTKDTQHRFNAKETDWGFSTFMPLSKLYDLERGYLLNDTCVIEADLSVDCVAHDIKEESDPVELEVQIFPLNEKIVSINDQYWDLRAEEVTAIIYCKDKSSWQLDLSVLPFFAMSSLRIPEEEKNIGPRDCLIHVYHFVKNTAQNQLKVVLPRSHPMGSHSESPSFDDMDAYISELVSVVETDAPFDSTSKGSATASINPQSTFDEAKKFFIKMLSQDLSEIPYSHIAESIPDLSKCCNLTSSQREEMDNFKLEFLTLLETYKTSKHSLKVVEEKMTEKQGIKNSLVEQVKINAFAFQTRRAIHKDLVSKEAELQAELTNISGKKRSSEKEIKQLHGKMISLEQSRSSLLEEFSTLETRKKTAKSTLSLVQKKWTELRRVFMEPTN